MKKTDWKYDKLYGDHNLYSVIVNHVIRGHYLITLKLKDI